MDDVAVSSTSNQKGETDSSSTGTETKGILTELTPCNSGSVDTMELTSSCPGPDLTSPPGSLSPQSSQDSFLSQDLCPLQPTTTISGPIEPTSIPEKKNAEAVSLADSGDGKNAKSDNIVCQEKSVSVSSSPPSSSSSTVSSTNSSDNNSSRSNEDGVAQNFGEIIKSSIVETVSA